MNSARLIVLLMLLSPINSFSQKYDLILTGGKIVDGSGNSWFYGDVGIKNGKIAAIGKLSGTDATRVLDVHGLVVAPGFIDVHTHIETNDTKVPTAPNFIYDGVTSVVTGNCGSSNTDIASYFSRLDSVKTSINIAPLSATTVFVASLWVTVNGIQLRTNKSGWRILCERQ
jgi:N-acyl-D-amino-acid deacylase